MRSLFISLFALCQCAEPGGSTSGDATGPADSTAADATDGETSGPDTFITDTATAPDVSDSAGADAAPDVPVAGPDDPIVNCLRDADCGEQLCCTVPLSYRSDCVAETDCSGGLQDACLTDAQCAARRPGEWTVCCHDRGDRNYCAPIAGTCQPLVPCTTPADCAGNGNDVCCSPHPYYEGSFCTPEFFAVPQRDCE